MIDLDELMRLREAATPGPWKVATWYGGYHTIRPKKEPEKALGQIENKHDAAYIVAACNAVPELVARIRDLEDQRDVLSTWIANTFIDSGFLPEIETGGMNPPTPEDVREAVIKVISERKGENRA